MTKAILFCFLFLLVSCSSYYDTYGDINDKYYNLKFGNDYNILTVVGGMAGSADRQYFYPQKFEIYLPKNIKGMAVSGGTYIFEYDNRQIIAINPGYQNYNKRPEKWQLEDTSEKYLADILSYWRDRKYSIKIFDEPNENRVSKIYANGEARIFLFNIKPENFTADFELCKSFKYLD